jgi:uncharacterized protein (TIGR02996 family)
MSTTEHPDWPALMSAIVADPDDDTVRLAAADFLEEHGDPNRAAFIRIQVELARLEAAGEGKSLDADHLRAKERAFLGPLSHAWKLWAAEGCPELVKMPDRGGGRGPLEGMTVEGAERLTWRRGFVDAVTCQAEEWLRLGVVVRTRQPIREITLTNCHPVTMDQWWAMLTPLRGLRRVRLAYQPELRIDWLREQLPGVDVEPVPMR